MTKNKKIFIFIVSLFLIVGLIAGSCYFYNNYQKKSIEWLDFGCLSKNGWDQGAGRYSLEGEFSKFFNKEMKAGEYVIFKYPGSEKEYTFLARNCKVILQTFPNEATQNNTQSEDEEELSGWDHFVKMTNPEMYERSKKEGKQ